MKCFRISINDRDDGQVCFRIDELRGDTYRLFNVYVTSSSNASSRLVYEKEKASEGLFFLEIRDNRKKFCFV